MLRMCLSLLAERQAGTNQMNKGNDYAPGNKSRYAYISKHSLGY